MKQFSDPEVQVLYAPENAGRLRGATRDMAIDDWSPHWGAVEYKKNVVSFFTPKAVSVYPNYQALEEAVNDIPQQVARKPQPQHIYSIDCDYHGLTVNFPDDTEESRLAGVANFTAEKLVVAAMKKLGMHCFHQYSWPDGSLYKWGTFADGSSPPAEEVGKALNKELWHTDVQVTVRIDDDRKDPLKGRYKTLRDYVNSKTQKD